MCIITSARIYTSLPFLPARHWRRATAASPPCPSGLPNWPCAMLSACSYSKKVHTLKRQCPALSMPLLPAAHHLVPIVHTEYHDHAPPPPPLPLVGRTPHTIHAPTHASCPTCRSRAPASLVASISSAAAASCALKHARCRAVLPFCTCVYMQMRHSTHACVGGCGRTSKVERGIGRG